MKMEQMYPPGYSRVIPPEVSVRRYAAFLEKYKGNPPHAIWARYNGSVKWEALHRWTHGGQPMPRNPDGSSK